MGVGQKRVKSRGQKITKASNYGAIKGGLSFLTNMSKPRGLRHALNAPTNPLCVLLPAATLVGGYH